MNVDKRAVHTDALETLGHIIGTGEHRDAIHLAVEPAVAAEVLYPGQDIGFITGGFGKSDNPVGIVDPFLKHRVEIGQHFWLLVYPRQITSLRHVWTHPAFDSKMLDLPEVVAPEIDTKKEASEEWLRTFCKTSDAIDYDSLLQVLTKGATSTGNDEDDYYFHYRLEYEGIFASGTDAHGKIPREFWDHAEVITGISFVHMKNRETYFSCSC